MTSKLNNIFLIERLFINAFYNDLIVSYFGILVQSLKAKLS